MSTKVVNLRTDKYDIYIGRPGKGQDGYFGNPHPIGLCYICKRGHDRDESIARYTHDFRIRLKNDREFVKRVVALKDKTLGCFCAPQKCHGDILAYAADNILKYCTVCHWNWVDTSKGIHTCDECEYRI